MALPRSKHPAGFTGGMIALGICLFMLAKMPEVHAYGIAPYMSSAINTVLWLFAAFISFCFGFGLGMRFDKKPATSLDQDDIDNTEHRTP